MNNICQLFSRRIFLVCNLLFISNTLIAMRGNIDECMHISINDENEHCQLDEQNAFDLQTKLNTLINRSTAKKFILTNKSKQSATSLGFFPHACGGGFLQTLYKDRTMQFKFYDKTHKIIEQYQINPDDSRTEIPMFDEKALQDILQIPQSAKIRFNESNEYKEFKKNDPIIMPENQKALPILNDQELYQFVSASSIVSRSKHVEHSGYQVITTKYKNGYQKEVTYNRGNAIDSIFILDPHFKITSIPINIGQGDLDDMDKNLK